MMYRICNGVVEFYEVSRELIGICEAFEKRSVCVCQLLSGEAAEWHAFPRLRCQTQCTCIPKQVVQHGEHRRTARVRFPP